MHQKRENPKKIGKDFSPTEPLTTRIRGIIQNYPGKFYKEFGV